MYEFDTGSIKPKKANGTKQLGKPVGGRLKEGKRRPEEAVPQTPTTRKRKSDQKRPRVIMGNQKGASRKGDRY